MRASVGQRSGRTDSGRLRTSLENKKPAGQTCGRVCGGGRSTLRVLQIGIFLRTLVRCEQLQPNVVTV